MAKRTKSQLSQPVYRNPKYVVGYCRFSSDNQREESIEGQQLLLREYAKQHELIIIDWYLDRAQSAKDDNRPEFQRMVDECSAKEFGQLLVYKVDRFSRNVYDFLKYEKFFQEQGVNIIYTAQPEMSHPMIKYVYAYMAEQFLDNLSLDVTRGRRMNAEKGLRNGGNVPYGYKLVAQLDETGAPLLTKKGKKINDLVIDPEQEQGVKLMFKMTIDGYTRADIVKALDEKGFRREKRKRQNEKFQGTSVDCILRNERYTGEYDFNYNEGTRKQPKMATVRVTNEFPPIISKEDFQTVQRLLGNRKHRPPCNAEENYLLTGKVMCGDCGSQYNGLRGRRNGKIYTYYKCTDQKSYVNGIKQEQYCRNNSVQKEKLEQFVIAELKRVVFNEKFIDRVYEEYNNYVKAQSVNKTMIEVLKRKIAEYDTKIKNWYNAIESGQAPDNAFARIRELGNEKAETEQRLTDEMGGIDFVPVSKSNVAKIYRRAREVLDGDDIREKRNIISNFVNKVIVKKEKVEVYINLIPTTCCASLDLDILDTHLFSGELSQGAWTLEETTGTPAPKNLKEYRERAKKSDAKFRPDHDTDGLKVIDPDNDDDPDDDHDPDPNTPKGNGGNGNSGNSSTNTLQKNSNFSNKNTSNIFTGENSLTPPK